MKLNLLSEHTIFQFSRGAVLVFILGFIIRLFAFHNTYLIPPDGTLYISQARGLYYGQWQSVTSCGLSYLSNYSIFIAAAYTIFHNWVIAGMSVSLFFGFATLIPLYLLFKCFFDERISVLGTLIYAFIPVFVGDSADVIRDPTYWFFSVLGLYLFLFRIDRKNYLYLLFSSLSFLMATWARVEAFLFVIVSCLYILAINKKQRIQKFAIFITPIVFIIIFTISGASLFHISIHRFNRTGEILHKLPYALHQYKILSKDMAYLAQKEHKRNLPFFLPEARNNIWLIAMGTLLNRALEAFFYPYFLIFLIGLAGIKEKIKNDLRVFYLTLLTGFAVLLLYFHILQTWMIYYRFLAIVIFPAFIFAGYGLEKIMNWMETKFNFKKSASFVIVFILIFIAALPKNLKARRADKIVFKQIANVLVEREGNNEEIKVSTSFHIHRWISFYSNLKYKGNPCPEPTYDNSWEKYANDYGKLLLDLKKRGIKYFLWEEKYWPAGKFNADAMPYRSHFKLIGKWYHRDTGRMELYAVK